MATTYQKKKKQNNAIHTIATVVLILAVFLNLVHTFYTQAEDEAYEMLHIQTKQIKDDIILQVKSDRENLVTMANFASKLYADGEDYDIMFESFKPIGLFSNIGILNPDNSFVTKMGTIDLDGKISFSQEAERGAYISGRIPDLTREGKEIVRSAVPIRVDDKIVGILYGVIHLDTIGNKYNAMAKELDAQLFVYDKETGKFIIDTIDENPGDLSGFKNSEYNDDYSYEKLVGTDKGYSSFKSIKTGEDLYIHYSTIEDFDWGIMLARYETQVFAETHKLSQRILIVFGFMILIMGIYLQIVIKNEKNRARLGEESAAVRKLLLDTNESYTNITEAMRNITLFAKARSAFFSDTDGEDFCYIVPSMEGSLLTGENRRYFQRELFAYVAKVRSENRSAFEFLKIVPDKHLEKTNNALYSFLKKHQIHEVSFAIISESSNHTAILGTINPAKSNMARDIIEEVAVCFSIAIHNKKHLNNTLLAATTDSLTGVLNRVAYKKDIRIFDRENPEDFSCIYVDVNELHSINNLLGHAAGDEMLIYIANTLKEVFFGHKVYRMGGDEFLVFTHGVDPENVRKGIELFMKQLKLKNYTVAVGMSTRSKNYDCEELVREAEVRMYVAKSQYYQKKGQSVLSVDNDRQYVQTKTGIREIDTMISILKEHYNGIYRVSLENNHAHRILMPSYLGYNEEEDNFQGLLISYMDTYVHPDSRRAFVNFINYDAIKRQLLEGNIPSVRYKKISGETVTVSVYKLDDSGQDIRETLWVFAKS